jgi:hypothetical protein
MHAPVARRPPPEHAFTHPGVGSGAGSWGEIEGATGNAIRVGGYLFWEGSGGGLMQCCIPRVGVHPHHILLLRVGGCCGMVVLVL